MKKSSEDKDALEPVKLTQEELNVLKMNERLIVNLLERIISIGNEMLSEELRVALLDAYVSLQQSLKLESVAIKFLLGKFGFDIEMMLEQRKPVAPVNDLIESSSRKEFKSTRNAVVSPHVTELFERKMSMDYPSRINLTQGDSMAENSISMEPVVRDYSNQRVE